MRGSVFALILLAIVGHAAACNDGKSGDPNRDQTAEPIVESVTDDQIAVMPLTAEELSEALGLQFAADPAEPIDAGAAAGKGAGWINGYQNNYFPTPGGDDVECFVQVDLYETAGLAFAAQARLLDQAKGLVGERAGEESDFLFDEVEMFDVPSLAAEAKGLRLWATGSDQPPPPPPPGASFTIAPAVQERRQTAAVIFTNGRLLIAISVTRYDDSDVASQAEKSARAQLERIEGILRGDR